MGEPFPKHGPEFNQWNGGLLRLATLIESAADEFWWCCDTQLKYLSLTIDTRDGGYVLKDRDGTVIQPERVEAAIEKWREKHGGPIARRKEPSNV